jgi:DNA polymerase-3 subunit alpha
LDDLTKADESMIEACDRAFDRAKHQSTRMAQAKSAPSKPQEQKPQAKKEQAMKPISIKLDANQTRLSHILQLKQLFSQHQGTTPIQIHFHTSAKSLAILHIDSQGGITVTEQFKQKVNAISCVLAIESEH